MVLRRFLSIVLILLSMACLSGCTATVNEPCMYCQHRPSKEYEKSDGTMAYVCENCSDTCMICSRKKATEHYESLLGIVFVCDDCYEMALSYQ